MTTAWSPGYQSTTDNSHKTQVHWGDWHVFAYCMERGCDWESVRTNHYYADFNRFDRLGRQHTKKMNRWWRRIWRRLTSSSVVTDRSES